MSGSGGVREARPDELSGWDDRTVQVPGGSIEQSLAWGEHRARLGWRAHHLVLDDGSAVLALGRRWPLIGGGHVYVPKGPVAGGAAAPVVAARLDAVARWARANGYDTILADAEMLAATGYGSELAARGFRPAEEVGPSRHRVATPIPPGADEEALLAGITKTTRQRFFAAERRGMRVVRYDARATSPGAGFEAPAAAAADGATGEAFERFHALLRATGERRGFAIGTRSAAVAWWRAALSAGFLVLLEARSADDAFLGAAIFYRNGERLTYANSGDVVGLRHAQPGAVHLLVWRALQLAVREGRSELDLGGVDVAGARFEPRPGDAMFGLLEFKGSFGGRWVELAGAHEKTLRPARARAGEVLTGLARGARRLTGDRGAAR
jgi:lipid II:glycine glycyltransferase (peptidoglycan interpeptide bridge formation enzyme)